MNYMKDVAKMLGVELGEEFEIDYGSTRKATANITKTGLHIISTNLIDFSGGDLNRVTLDWLLIGHCSIKRKPWKPKYGEHYYSIGPGGVLEPGTWMGDFIDVIMYRLGNCYRTEQKAESNRDKWISFYASDEMLNLSFKE